MWRTLWFTVHLLKDSLLSTLSICWWLMNIPRGYISFFVNYFQLGSFVFWQTPGIYHWCIAQKSLLIYWIILILSYALTLKEWHLRHHFWSFCWNSLVGYPYLLLRLWELTLTLCYMYLTAWLVFCITSSRMRSNEPPSSTFGRMW